MVTSLIKIGASWCGPCRMLDKELDKFTMVPVERYDADEVPEICEQYKVRNVPVLIFLDESGQEVHRIIGLTTAKMIESIIAELNG